MLRESNILVFQNIVGDKHKTIDNLRKVYAYHTSNMIFQ